MALSAITQAAVDAAKAERTARIGAAKTQLAAFLDGKVAASVLSVADVDDEKVVVTDGTVYLSVAASGVRLVEGQAGDWTWITDPLDSLVELGKVLA